jgi:hypothetical protein
MKGKYSQLIQEYCEKEHVEIPVGFKRGSANHLAIIRRDSNPSKLVAKTYFNKTDIKYYIKHTLAELPADELGYFPALVIDFKENQIFKCTLSKSGEGKLEKL